MSAESSGSALRSSLRSTKKVDRSFVMKNADDPGKYRPMHRFTPVQREKLLRLFATNRYPSTDVKRSLAEEFHVSIHRISCWFNEKRRARNNYLGLQTLEKPRVGSHRFPAESPTEVQQHTHKRSCNNKQLLTKRQLEVLSATFEKKKYISAAEQAALCIQLGLSENQITNWFVHRRHRLRKTALGIGLRLGERELFELFSPIQLTEFLHFYNKPEMPTMTECSKLASELQVSAKRVMAWFQKRDRVCDGEQSAGARPLGISLSSRSSDLDQTEFGSSFDSSMANFEFPEEQMDNLSQYNDDDDENVLVESPIGAVPSGGGLEEDLIMDSLDDANAVESTLLGELTLPVDLSMSVSPALLSRLAKLFNIHVDWMEGWCKRSFSYCREKRALFYSSSS